MKKILLILGIVGLSLLSFTQAENFKYECSFGTIDNSCFSSSFGRHAYDLVNKTYKNQGYFKTLRDGTFDINLLLDKGSTTLTSGGINISENDILKLQYEKKTTNTGYDFTELKFYKNRKLIANFGNVNNVTTLKLDTNLSTQLFDQNQRKLSTSMDLQSASITDQISSLMSGKFVTMLATIIAIIALFSVIIRYVLKAIFK